MLALENLTVSWLRYCSAVCINCRAWLYSRSYKYLVRRVSRGHVELWGGLKYQQHRSMSSVNSVGSVGVNLYLLFWIIRKLTWGKHRSHFAQEENWWLVMVFHIFGNPLPSSLTTRLKYFNFSTGESLSITAACTRRWTTSVASLLNLSINPVFKRAFLDSKKLHCN